MTTAAGPAIRPQPRRRHSDAVWAHTPTAPWGVRRLPRTLLAGDPRRTLYRSLLRCAEGVPVTFADGSSGVVTDVVLPALGFDFWAEQLVVATPEGARRVSSRDVRAIHLRRPHIEVGPTP